MSLRWWYRIADFVFAGGRALHQIGKSFVVSEKQVNLPARKGELPSRIAGVAAILP